MKILYDVKTYENLLPLISEVNAVSLELAGRNESLEEVVEKEAPKNFPLILMYLHSKNAFDKDSAVVELEKLGGLLEKVKKLEIKMAMEASDEFIKQVFDWTQKNISGDVVLSFKKDPTIVSGAVITYEGKYTDLSSAKKIKKAIKEMQESKESKEGGGK
jgi:F0F1-type ATP synthase delta subunit